MKITPIEIKEYSFRKKTFGYDPREVEALKERVATALEEANSEKSRLEAQVRDMEEKLAGHLKNESLLKEAITSTQKMTMDIKDNARKEAELVIAEAQVRGDDIIRQAQSRATEINEEILRLKKQRAEFESSLKALIYYHTTQILIEEEESTKATEEANKIKYMPTS